jgi:hypothetical protein
METHQLQSLVDQRHRILGIICFALLASVAIYVGIAFVLIQQGSIPTTDSAELPEIFPVVLCAIAVLTVMGAQVMAAALLKQNLARATGEDPTPRLNAFQSAVIIGFAMREAAAVMGLVLTFLTGEILWVVGLSAVAAAAMLLAWPRKQRMLEIARGGPMALG